MADDNVDFRFLGQQVKNLQAEVRDLRAGHLRLESDVVGLRSDLSRIEQQLADLAEKVEANHVTTQAQFALVRAEFTALVFRLDEKIDNHHRADQAQITQMSQTNATMLQIVITKLTDIEARLPAR